ncbi:hypothetical protein D3C84_1175920 [compost metagenome]
MDVSQAYVYTATSSPPVALAADEYVMVNQFITSHLNAGYQSYFGVTLTPGQPVKLVINVFPGSMTSINIGYFALPIAKVGAA